MTDGLDGGVGLVAFGLEGVGGVGFTEGGALGLPDGFDEPLSGAGALLGGFGVGDGFDLGGADGCTGLGLGVTFCGTGVGRFTGSGLRSGWLGRIEGVGLRSGATCGVGLDEGGLGITLGGDTSGLRWPGEVCEGFPSGRDGISFPRGTSLLGGFGVTEGAIGPDGCSGFLLGSEGLGVSLSRSRPGALDGPPGMLGRGMTDGGRPSPGRTTSGRFISGRRTSMGGCSESFGRVFGGLALSGMSLLRTTIGDCGSFAVWPGWNPGRPLSCVFAAKCSRASRTTRLWSTKRWRSPSLTFVSR